MNDFSSHYCSSVLSRKVFQRFQMMSKYSKSQYPTAESDSAVSKSTDMTMRLFSHSEANKLDAFVWDCMKQIWS